MTAGADELWDEIGFLGYHLNWSLDDLLNLPNGRRQKLIEQVRRLARDGAGNG